MEVFIATPAYQGNGRIEPFEKSLRSTTERLKDLGIPTTWMPLEGCCYLPVARNKLVRAFLESTATDFVFIDIDIAWEPETMLRLLSYDVDIVCAAYRYKVDEEGYPVWLRTGPDDVVLTDPQTGLIQVWAAPTGFMRIQRKAFEDMEAFYGEDLIVDEYDNDSKLRETYLNFFDTEKIGRRWWGEDCNFCRKWTMEMQRPLWVMPDADLIHYSDSKEFHGNLHKYLMTRPFGFLNPHGYPFNKITGWTSEEELLWLFHAATEMETIVEIGSHLGRSAHALLSGCQGKVFCVDSWVTHEDIKPGDTQANASERFKEFLKNTEQFQNRMVVRKDSLLAAANGDVPKAVDMVFIDASHDYKSVCDDINAWLPKAKKLICGHDYETPGWPDVKKAVDEKFGDKVNKVGSIWYVNLQESEK